MSENTLNTGRNLISHELDEIPFRSKHVNRIWQRLQGQVFSRANACFPIQFNIFANPLLLIPKIPIFREWRHKFHESLLVSILFKIGSGSRFLPENQTKNISLPLFDATVSFSLEKLSREKLFYPFAVQFSHFLPKNCSQNKFFSHFSIQFHHFLSINCHKKNYFAIFRYDTSISSQNMAQEWIIFRFVDAIFLFSHEKSHKNILFCHF